MRIAALLLLAIGAPALGQTQAEMNRDAGTDFARADAAMTREWRRTYAAMKAMDAGDRTRGGGFGYAPATLASQRAWLQYRDRQCLIEGGQFAGGSMQPMAQAQCRARLTKARTAELRSLRWER